MPKKELKELEPQYRDFEVRQVNAEEKTVELSFSSEEPYERWFGIEILDHSPTSVNMERLNNSAPLLFNHDRDVVIGVVEFAKIENRRGLAVVRFGNSEKAKEVFSDVADGIMKNVSVGYQIDEMKLESESDGLDTYRVTRWKPFEISIVSIPADNTVGVGRSNDLEKNEVKIINLEKEENSMPKDLEVNEEVSTAQNEARKAEKIRVREITAIGTAHGMTAEATKAIDDDTSLDSFRALVLKKLGEPVPTVNTQSPMPEIGMNEKEIKRYSFAKALRALANPNDRRAQDEAAFEFEISQEAQKRSGIIAQGVLVPFDVFARDLTVAGTNGVTVSTGMGGLIDLLKNKSAVMQLAEILPGLVGNVSFPKKISSMTVSKLTEGQSTTNSDIGLDELVMSPSRFGGSGVYSKQLLHQSSIAIENMIRNDLLGEIGLKIDMEAVLKILAETGVGLVSIGDNGGAIANSHIVDMETEISVDNADVGRLAYLMNARTRGFLKKTPVTSGNPKMILDGMELNGYGYQVSNQLPANLTKGTGTNLSALIFGNFQNLLVGLWGGIDLTVDPYSLSKEGKISIVADQFADVGVRRAESFAVLKDAAVTA